MRIMIGSQRDADLRQVLKALLPPSLLAGLLNGRKQKRNQNDDGAEHDRQFQDRERTPPVSKTDGESHG